MPFHLPLFAPLALLILSLIWIIAMKKACKFTPPADAPWPFAASPQLALELATSPLFVTEILGARGTETGGANRASAIRFQKLDFIFILFYVLFFIAVANVSGRGQLLAPFAMGCAIATGLADMLEDLAILRLTGPKPRGSSKAFGQLKWILYFLTLALEGALLLRVTPANVRTVAGFVLGAFLISVAIGGVISSFKGTFNGIDTGAKLSSLGMIGLAVLPLFAAFPHSWGTAAAYIALMRVPLLTAVLLIALPFLSFHTGARSLLRGLFDLKPASLFIVTLAALAVSGTASMTGYLVLNDAHARFGVGPQPLPDAWLHSSLLWLSIMFAIALPLISYAIYLSVREKHGTFRLVGAALAGVAIAIGLAALLLFGNLQPFSFAGLEQWLSTIPAFAGYAAPGTDPDPWTDHLRASEAFFLTLVLYILTGIYGWRRIGKRLTVPALCSVLMMIMLLCWMLSASAFFFDRWHVPLLLIVAIAGTLTAQSTQSDHFYDLRRRNNPSPPPTPAGTLRSLASGRLIVVAANGGGIQAGAWAAKVLHGLLEDCGSPFRNSLRLISSVSGGSVGTACFVHWLANPEQSVIPPIAAASSSLDEVAWGLAWPDLIRSLVPWFFGWLIGRGRALEKAWLLNSTVPSANRDLLDKPLSDWNARVATGELPAVIMNATITESGQRLLLATTRLASNITHPRARMEASTLHTVNGTEFDVGIVTAARLSASFPYVTPAARAQSPDPKPHVVDGGYYDNYGMATLVEWLDEALAEATNPPESVLVIQIHGAPIDPPSKDKPANPAEHPDTRGWFYQAIAPLATLASVRSAGQLAHNDIELSFLQTRWLDKGLPIHAVTFEFTEPDAPMSWHLTETQKQNIDANWNKEMADCRRRVKQFLSGDKYLACGCPWCAGVGVPPALKK